MTKWRERFLGVKSELRAYLQTHPSLQGIPYWAAALATGLAAVLYAGLFKKAEVYVQRLLQSAHPALFLGLSPVFFVLSWWIVKRLRPAAAGSGIPQVMAAEQLLEYKKDAGQVRRLLGLRVAAVKVLSSLLLVLGGGAVGREGPTIQIAASIFLAAGRRFHRIWPQITPHSWIVAGGAAGVAAAFNTPLGGIVYAIEELSDSHFNKFKTSLIAAVIISGMAAQWFLGSYLYLGYPALPKTPYGQIPYAVLTGAITGLCGALFGRMLRALVEWRSAFEDRTLRRAFLAAGCGLAVAALAVFVDGRAAGSGREVILELLFQAEKGEISWTLPLLRFFSPVITYLAGGAGGIFAPSLAAGASIGALIAPLAGAEYMGLHVMVGMVGFLTGVTRAPFTAFVLVLEMTDRHSIIFPMMLAALCAAVVGRAVDPHSFYHYMKEYYLKETPHESKPG